MVCGAQIALSEERTFPGGGPGQSRRPNGLCGRPRAPDENVRRLVEFRVALTHNDDEDAIVAGSRVVSVVLTKCLEFIMN